MLKDWKKANVTPVFKRSKKKDLENFRLASLTLILRKAMELLILEVISRLMKEKKVIWSSQHGFSKRK